MKIHAIFSKIHSAALDSSQTWVTSNFVGLFCND
jgi:hypothetical protein